jgi:hypothetical protein
LLVQGVAAVTVVALATRTLVAAVPLPLIVTGGAGVVAD